MYCPLLTIVLTQRRITPTTLWSGFRGGKKLMKGMTITNHLLEEAADGSGSEPKRMSRRRKKRGESGWDNRGKEGCG